MPVNVDAVVFWQVHDAQRAALTPVDQNPSGTLRMNTTNGGRVNAPPMMPGIGGTSEDAARTLFARQLIGGGAVATTEDSEVSGEVAVVGREVDGGMDVCEAPWEYE